MINFTFVFYTYFNFFTFQINDEGNYIFLFWKTLEPYCHTLLEFPGRKPQGHTLFGRATPGIAVGPLRKHINCLSWGRNIPIAHTKTRLCWLLRELWKLPLVFRRKRWNKIVVGERDQEFWNVGLVVVWQPDTTSFSVTDYSPNQVLARTLGYRHDVLRVVLIWAILRWVWKWTKPRLAPRPWWWWRWWTDNWLEYRWIGTIWR